MYSGKERGECPSSGDENMRERLNSKVHLLYIRDTLLTPHNTTKSITQAFTNASDDTERHYVNIKTYSRSMVFRMLRQV